VLWKERLVTGWTVRGLNPGESEVFRTRPDRPWGPPSPLYNVYRVIPAVKAVGSWHWPPNTSSVEVKERVKPYLYSPLGPLCPVLGQTLPLWKRSYRQSFCILQSPKLDYEGRSMEETFFCIVRLSKRYFVFLCYTLITLNAKCNFIVARCHPAVTEEWKIFTSHFVSLVFLSLALFHLLLVSLLFIYLVPPPMLVYRFLFWQWSTYTFHTRHEVSFRLITERALGNTFHTERTNILYLTPNKFPSTQKTRQAMYRGADKSLARPGKKQSTATEDFEFHMSYL
jgi:hypothetical protein